MRHRASVLAVAALLALLAPSPARAWGHTGHVILTRAAAQGLPDTLPAFVRSEEAVFSLAELGPEPDLLKGAGASFDRNESPGHYLDLADDGSVLGIVPLASLPQTREAYDSALRARGSNQYQAGFLPYSIVDGFEVVRKDFAWWRVMDLASRNATAPDDRAYFARMRALRELLTIRDIGYWSHFVGDGSQPLHVSVHFDGWEERYPGSKGLHAAFESAYVSRYVDDAAVRSRMQPFSSCGCTTAQEVEGYLAATAAQVQPVYELFERGAFAARTDAGVGFAADRLAAGATQLRNMIVEAWVQSEDGSVGYPPAKVRDVDSGSVTVTRTIFGRD